MKKLVFCLLISLGLSVMMPVGGISAAGDKTVVFLKDNGKGDGSTAALPVGSLEDAFAALDLTKDCTVVVCGQYTQTKSFNYKGGDYTGSVTITSVYGNRDYGKTGGAAFRVNAVQFVCRGKTEFRDIKIEALGDNFIIVGRHHPIKMGENVTIAGSKLKGSTVANSICIFGGYHSGFGDPASSSKDTDITVLSGEKYYIFPFARNMKVNNTGTATIRVGGTAAGQIHGSSAGGSGSKMGKVNVEISGSANIKMFYGATEAATVEGYEFTWTGGNLAEIQWNCKYASKSDLKVLGKKVLNVSEEMTRAANYNAISSQFDEVNVIGEAEDYETVKNAEVVYLKSGEKGDGSSPDKPLGSLAMAYGALDLTKDCTVVIVGKYTQTADFDFGTDHTGSVTVTSVYGGKDYRDNGAEFVSDAFSFACRGTTVFENLNIRCTGNYYLLVAQHNPVTIGEGVNISGNKLIGSSVDKSFSVIGGYASGVGSPTAIDGRDTSITVLSGSKLYVVAYSRQMQGDYPGTAHIKIGGDANVSVLHGSVAYYMSTIVGNVEIEITDNAKVGTFYGCTQITTAGSYRFVWRSGTITKFQWNCQSTPDAKLTVLGKTELYASEEVRNGASFKSISANFDVVEDISKLPAAPEKTDVSEEKKIPEINTYTGYEKVLISLELLKKAEQASDYERGMTRAEALVQVVRLMGAEDEALTGSYAHPFKDVPEWAEKYVAYAYEKGITHGVSKKKFDPEGEASPAHYLTFLLRAIGYDDNAGDFKWKAPYELALKAGMTASLEDGSDGLNYGISLKYSWNTIFATAKDGTKVSESFAARGVFTEDRLYSVAARVHTEEKYGQTKLKAENGYYVLPIETYKDKTKAGLLAQFTGFLSGYEFKKNSDGSATLSMPDEWFELCNGPYAEYNSRNVHADKLLQNSQSGLWEVWNDDDFSIDILDQYILRDMYERYGTFASKVITDDWVKYNVYDMGGGHRSYGAYGLMNKHGYLPLYTGNVEYGNMYNVNGEPFIGNETLGMSAAGMPAVAAYHARSFGSATSDRDSLRWLEYFTTLISMGYLESDIPTMMRQAQSIFVEGSWQWKVVDMVFDLHERFPDDWRRAVIHATETCWQKHYDNDGKVAENAQNCAMILIGLLYGEGDFYETCKIISLAGHGGDSTTPVGLSAVAVICGWSGIDDASKNIINKKIWQDGKGILVNLPVEGSKEAYWMCCLGLPERIGMQELLDLYQKNFESNLLANGGKIENGNYYIPENTLGVIDTVFADEFEDGTLDGYTVKGSVENAEGSFSGERGAKLTGCAAGSALEREITGLTVGASYRLSAFITSAASVTTDMYVMNGGEKTYVSVYDQSYYVARELIFTAKSDSVTIGFSIPAGTPDHKYAIVDEVYVIRAEEISAGTVEFDEKNENDIYNGSVSFNIKANEKKEYLLKLTFTNESSVVVRGNIAINGKSYATAPFHTTGDNGMGIVYIPVIAENGTDIRVKIDFSASKLGIYSAELVEIKDRW
ncbi:MAG: S-layer homology domain-containing protein [Clostridia bacterium]|nr:S-layer homology domain-containing protein [Clostridia bacterium]